MDPIRKIPKKFTKKFGNKVIKRQCFRRKTGLKCTHIWVLYSFKETFTSFLPISNPFLYITNWNLKTISIPSNLPLYVGTPSIYNTNS